MTTATLDRSAKPMTPGVLTHLHPRDGAYQGEGIKFETLTVGNGVVRMPILDSHVELTAHVVRHFAAEHVRPNAGKVEEKTKVNLGGYDEVVTDGDIRTSEMLLHYADGIRPSHHYVGEGLQGQAPSPVELLKGAPGWVRMGNHTEEHFVALGHTDAFQTGWQFDPIDGTWEYKENRDGYAVMGALLEGCGDGVTPVSAVIWSPRGKEKSDLFACDFSNACRLTESGQKEPLAQARSLEEIRASGVLKVHVREVFFEKHVDRAHPNFNFNVDHMAGLFEYMEELRQHLGVERIEYVKNGGSGAGLAQLLRGGNDGGVDLVITAGGDKPKMWDATPAAAFARAISGCWFSDAAGQEMRFDLKQPELQRGWAMSRSLTKEEVFPFHLRELAEKALIFSK